jgi:2-polyprenyl-3-methyl-5-hydroxy-6-metoxy-1,4-benzoquinol methylase
VGCLDGRKYRHLLRFTPYAELLAENTQKEYEKKGVAVDALGGERIFPSGKVWLPTSEKYLQDYVKILAGVTGKGEMSMLDIGCGSGILSFLFARQFRKSRVCAIDKNPDAVRTCNINAARL